MATALFPGSFNPFTLGHADIVSRGLEIFDSIVIAVGVNAGKAPADAEAVARPIRMLYADEPRVSVVTYNTFTPAVGHELQSYGQDVSRFLPNKN